AGKGKGRGAVRTPRTVRVSDDPNLIYGRPFDDEIRPLSSYGANDEGTVAVKGRIFGQEVREMRNGERSIISFAVTDGTDSIMVKLFVSNDDAEELAGRLKDGEWIRMKGLAQYDSFDKEVSVRHVQGILKEEPEPALKRHDEAAEKRVELHCHSKFSEKDGLADLDRLLDTARAWGHPALALTDHGYVYGFPEALHYLQKGKISDFKVIYGVEGYLVDDTKETVVRPGNRALSDTCVVFDLETTGLSPVQDRIIEIGAVKLSDGQIVDRFSAFVDPDMPIPFRIENLTGISDEMVRGAEKIGEILPRFMDFVGDSYLVAHNAEFDVSFLSEKLKQCGIPFTPFSYADTLGIAHAMLRHLKSYSLDAVAKEMNVPLGSHHRAVDDAECCAGIHGIFIRRFRAQGITTLKEAQDFVKPTADDIRRMHSHHVIILVKNETGRVNLYRTVSDSLLKYYGGRPARPRIPKSLLQERREGLIIGSACSMGELFNAVLEGQTDEELERIVSFYDYLEVQPVGNNQYLYGDTHYDIRTPEDLQALNRRIVALGDYYGKPVCATGDVHFIEPEDSIYRTILQAGSGYKESEETPLYFRTTEEMLEEFSYLGAEKAYEIVVRNTNRIADSIDVISPVRPDKCPPVIENADTDLKTACFRKAYEIYGNPLPPIVEERLNKELTSIIGNGYAVMYMIAEKLVKKSVSDGYLVGSRGSVGSSLAATMSG
ncbi:MAG: PHP domain-containing protein, partial [Lachnospiraceae bacterium]|nr:PHP domain-containing protein [Lachnospiraceae bacterium]